MGKEYFKILHCLKDHPSSCVALKPTALIAPEKIRQLSRHVQNHRYPDLDLEELCRSADVAAIAEPLLRLAHKAQQNQTRILIDAEQGELQPGVDLIALHLMRECNGAGKSVVYNTYQLYLKDSPKRLFTHKSWLAEQNVSFAAKIVRGAYLSTEAPIQERIHVNYRLCASKHDVDKNYDDTASLLVAEGKTDLVVATHNLSSVTLIKEILDSSTAEAKVEFAYLMGFGAKVRDRLQGHNSLEYVPYGPIDVKIPYLLRRLEENTTIFLGKTQ